MKKIVLGFIIISFYSVGILDTEFIAIYSFPNPTIDIANISFITVIPQFLGWCLIYFGAKELNKKWDCYSDKVMQLFILTIGISFVSFVLNAVQLRLPNTLEALWNLLRPVTFFVYVAVEYALIKGFTHIQATSQIDMKLGLLKNIYLLRLIPYFMMSLTNLKTHYTVFNPLEFLVSCLLLIAYIRVMFAYAFAKPVPEA